MSDGNPLIPKEKQSAYQRWELASFNEGSPSATLGNGKAAARTQRDTEYAQLQQHARNEGYAAGYTAGMQHAVEEQKRLGDLVRSLAQTEQLRDDSVAQALLELALAMTKRMLGVALPVHRELMLPMVREAIDQLPQATRTGALHLHPADVELVQSFLRDELGEHGFKLTGDAHIERGGCRIESGDCAIDATLPARWEHILATLSRDDAWIDVE
jgi:flagellar assembly protein FliH